MKRLALIALTAATPVVATLLAGVASAETFNLNSSGNFTSPSGNISCAIQPGSVRCDIKERDWKPPARPASCNENVGFGQGITLSTGREAEFVCAGDTTFGVGKPLAYGDTIVAGVIECTSEESGIQCWDTQYGGEFTIAREGYDVD
jgi:hypothetical protein